MCMEHDPHTNVRTAKNNRHAAPDRQSDGTEGDAHD